MKLLVTGGAGFIGSNFILYWLKKYPNDEVINFDNLTYAGNLENLKSLENNSRYHFIKGNIQDEEMVNQVMKGIEVVINFAAETHVDKSILGPAIFIKTNIVGTQVLLSVALRHKVKRFHHISTDEVFGSLEINSKDKFNEKSCLKPNSPYAASKAGADCLVRAWHQTYGLPTTITNTSNNFGPYQFPEKFIPLTITNLLEGKKVPIYGDGLNIRDWVYVEDHCRAIDLVIQKGKVGETYCIGGMTKDINNLMIAKKIIKLLGKKESSLEFVKDRPGHDKKYALNWKKAQKELGYQPKFDFDNYLAKTVAWYQKNQGWWQKIKSGDYQQYYNKWYKNKLKMNS